MRLSRWLFILFQFAWLNIVLPGHTRGAIPMPGAAADSCCSDSPDQTSDKHENPTPADRSRCAICYFAACVVTAPPAITLPTDAGPVGKAQIAKPPAFEGIAFYLPYHGRAPPV